MPHSDWLDEDGNLIIRYVGGDKGVMIASQVCTGEKLMREARLLVMNIFACLALTPSRICEIVNPLL